MQLQCTHIMIMMKAARNEVPKLSKIVFTYQNLATQRPFVFRCCKAIFQVVTCSIAVTINLTNVSSDSFGPVEEVRN